MVKIKTITGAIIEVNNLEVTSDPPNFAEAVTWVYPDGGFSPSVPHADLEYANLIIENALDGDGEIIYQDPPPPTVPGRVY